VKPARQEPAPAKADDVAEAAADLGDKQQGSPGHNDNHKGESGRKAQKADGSPSGSSSSGSSGSSGSSSSDDEDRAELEAKARRKALESLGK
jgi:hypothetical protein